MSYKAPGFKCPAAGVRCSPQCLLVDKCTADPEGMKAVVDMIDPARTIEAMHGYESIKREPRQ